MEIERWKKDETPYIVFSCKKCRRWLYGKTSQKIKKCLYCGASHSMQTMTKNKSKTIIKGLSNAITEVKSRQNQIALSEAGRAPDLQVPTEFTRSIPPKVIKKSNIPYGEGSDLNHRFQDLLAYLSQHYSKFPYYMIAMLSEQYHIPESELSILIHKSIQEKHLIPLKNRYFRIKKT